MTLSGGGAFEAYAFGSYQRSSGFWNPKLYSH